MNWKRVLPAVLLASSASLWAADNAKRIVLDFEGNSPEHVTDNPYEGSKCYKFAGPGAGKYAYRKIPLTLQENATYKLTLGIRKDVCASADSKKMDFVVGSYLPGSKKFTV